MTGQVTGTAHWDSEKRRLFLDDQMVFNASIARMRKLQHGEPFEIEATRLFGLRTSKHNAQYWGWIIRPIALASQQTQDEIHRLCKAAFLPTERLVLADPETGEVKFEQAVEGTTRRLREEDFRVYMEQCRELGMTKLGIDFSPQGLWEQFGIGEG